MTTAVSLGNLSNLYSQCQLRFKLIIFVRFESLSTDYFPFNYSLLDVFTYQPKYHGSAFHSDLSFDILSASSRDINSVL